MANFFAQFPASNSGSNASVGVNGDPIPLDSTLAGAKDGSGNLQPLNITAGGALKVDLTSASGGAVHVIVDSSALPSGASTAANQTSQITQETAIATSTASIDTKTPTVGQKAMTASSPVVIASDQASIPVAATLQAGSAIVGKVAIDQTTPGTTNGVQINAAIPAGANVIGHVIVDAGSAIMGKVAIDQTTPGTTNGVQVNAALPAGSNVIGHVIADASSAVIGHVIVDAGSAIIGKVTIDQTTAGTTNAVAVAQIGATTVATGNGTVSAGVQRVAIASDNSAFNTNAIQSGTWTVQPGNTANTTAWLTTSKGLATANAPISNDYTSVSVTTAAYVQLIASTTSATTFIDIFDSSGQAMILATGAGGSEVILAYIPPGGDSFNIAIPASTRVAYKALFATANTGYLLMNLRS